MRVTGAGGPLHHARAVAAHGVLQAGAGGAGERGHHLAVGRPADAARVGGERTV